MDSFGSINKLKESINNQFEQDIENAKNDSTLEINRIKTELKNNLNELRKEAEKNKEIESEKAYLLVFNEEKRKLQTEFDNKRQELIEKVFDEVFKKAKEFSESKEYLNFIKKKLKNLPNDFTVYGNSNKHKKLFKKFKEDTHILGVKAISSDLVYDLTITSLVNAKKEKLNIEINNILFGA